MVEFFRPILIRSDQWIEVKWKIKIEKKERADVWWLRSRQQFCGSEVEPDWQTGTGTGPVRFDLRTGPVYTGFLPVKISEFVV